MGNQIGAAVPPGVLTVTTLAKRLKVSRSTVVRWQRDGDIVPTSYMQAGKLRVALYDQANVRRIQRQRKTKSKETK